MPKTPDCILGKKDHSFVLIGDKRGNLQRKCAICKLTPTDLASLNQMTAEAITVEAVLLLLDANPDFDVLKQRLFDAARTAGIIPDRLKEADDDGS